MEFLALILVVVVFASVLGVPIVVFVILMPRMRALERKLGDAERVASDQSVRLRVLAHSLARLDARMRGASAAETGAYSPDPQTGPTEAEPPQQSDSTPPPQAYVQKLAPATEQTGVERGIGVGEAASATAPRMPHVARTGRAALPPASPETASSGHRDTLEEALTGRWLVWLGAVAVALSAVFLFTYAIEQGWLGPATRVALGLLLGGALTAGGEWLHRRAGDVGDGPRGTRADFVPPALTASGLFALFVSVYAAHGLYALIPAALAFPALGAVSFLGLALSLRQGWFVALLGLVGGFAVPALLVSEAPNALPVFLYLLAVTAGCLGLMVWRKWWWLSVATLAGALLWPLLWLIGPWTPGDQGVLGSYAVALAALFALLSVGLPVKRPGAPATAWLGAVLADTSGLGFALSGGLTVVLAVEAGFNEAAFFFLGLYAVAGLVLGLRRAAFESLAVVGALVTAVAFLAWPEPSAVSLPTELERLGVDRYATGFGPLIMPPEFVVFARSLAIFAAIFGVGGFLALRRGPTPAVWGAISAGMPVFLLVMGYWRIGAFEIDVQWAVLAVGLALMFLLAAALTPRVLPGPRGDVPLALYAAGTTAALALAFSCVLREAWLTVALSAEMVALGWLWTRLKVTELRLVAFAVAAAVVLRLVFNHHVLDYRGGVEGLFGWVLYGYGLPAVAFFLAARLFRREPGDLLAVVCEIAGTAFAFLMVAFQVRLWTLGSIASPVYGLFDQALQTVWWLAAAGLMLRREAVAHATWPRVAGIGLMAVAVAQAVIGHAWFSNPLFTPTVVGPLPVLNLLGLAYLLPAIMLWLIGATRGFALEPLERRATAVAAAFLVFVYVSLEVRHGFRGQDLSLSPLTLPANAELYAYSAGWIGYALALLALGIWQGSSLWRYASLAVLIVTVLKVFLYDMSDLTGLFRVASFLGLGLALIGIGWIYRRFVVRD